MYGPFVLESQILSHVPPSEHSPHHRVSVGDLFHRLFDTSTLQLGGRQSEWNSLVNEEPINLSCEVRYTEAPPAISWASLGMDPSVFFTRLRLRELGVGLDPRAEVR